ncbi:Rv1535 domain-containing protein [Mycobacterium noviomagense]|uniref:Rv1535 domain-containing protein n=1 Tax=Mycobacterium noviomagense TaxID=459858 RepID=UPI00355652F2
MATTDALADPLVSAVGALLTVPLVHLYALGWRFGVVDVVQSDRSSAQPESTAALALMLADQRRGGLAHPPRRLRRSPNPAPAPTRLDPAVYSRAAG